MVHHYTSICLDQTDRLGTFRLQLASTLPDTTRSV